MSLNLIIFGAPGVGKGTQAQILAENFNLIQVATGDIFRTHIKKETELGKKAKEYMDGGDLVPDDIVISIVEDRLNQHDIEKGFMLDGFPRTVPQAEKLEEVLQRLGMKIDGVINLVLDDDEIINRLCSRRICLSCRAVYNLVAAPPKVEDKCDKCGGEVIQRDDDRRETIKVRLVNYREQTVPVLDFYKKQDIVHDIKSEGGIEAVAQKAADIANSLKQ